MKQCLTILIGLMVFATWRVAWPLEEDVYGEEALPAFKEREKAPEQPVVFPGYPVPDRLIQVDLLLSDFPFTLWIDPASLYVDDEGVIRFTSVLRSASGAENVSYEGVRCVRRQYRRYAYGAQGRFHPVATSTWQFVRPINQDRHRAALIDGYLCPLPSGNREALLLRKLKGRNPGRHSYTHE